MLFIAVDDNKISYFHFNDTALNFFNLMPPIMCNVHMSVLL